MFKVLLCIAVELLIILTRTKTSVIPASNEDPLAIKDDWEECCKKHICIFNSCYFPTRKTSAWATVRQRCQGKYSDYPSLIDLFRIRREDDLKILSNFFHEGNDETLVSKRIWTGGMKCPKSEIKGPGPPNTYLTRWTSSSEPLPQWLMDRISSVNDKVSFTSGDCQFLAVSPDKNTSDVIYEFKDQLSDHAGLCEFLLPEEIETVTSTNLTTQISTSINVIENSSTSSESSKMSSEAKKSTWKPTTIKTKSKTLEPAEIETTVEQQKTTTSTSTTINERSTTINDTRLCKGRKEAGIQWPDTLPGVVIYKSCPEGMTGVAHWKCDEKTSRFTPKKPYIQDCKHLWIEDLEENIDKGELAIDISAKMANETDKQEMSHGDILALVNLSVKITSLFATQKQDDSDENVEFAGSMVSSMSNILRAGIKDAWQYLPISNQTKAASKMLEIVTIIGSHLSCIRKSEEKKLQYTVNKENIALQTFILSEEKGERNDQIVFPQNVEGVKANSSLTIPANLNLKKPFSACHDVNSAVGVLYNNIGEFLKNENNESSSNLTVLTKVISFSLSNNTNSVTLPKGKYVTISLKLNRSIDFLPGRLRCMFWNFSKHSFGQWDDSGCFLSPKDSNLTHITCSCNHLTNFAVLMDINDNIEGDEVLSLMTYICCGMSSFCLIITLICFLSMKTLHGRRSIITGNLCFALLFSNLLILFGLDETGNKIVCTTIAGFLHFWILSAFCWMLIEGYHLYKMVVLVFERGHQLSVKVYYLFAYGLPLLIVSITLGIRAEEYVGKTYCWLSSEKGLKWSFVGPACIIILINAVVFILTLRSASSVRIKKEQTTMKKIKNLTRGSMSVMCLLGLTWSIGLIYIDKRLGVFAYIFTVLNGLQGVFIFFFHVLLNEKVQALFPCRGSKKNYWQQCLHQTSSNQMHSKLSTRTSVNSMGCVSSGLPRINSQCPSNAISHQSSSRENVNINRQKLKTRKNINSKKVAATRTVSENKYLNNQLTRHNKARSQSFPEDRDNVVFCRDINQNRQKSSEHQEYS